MKRMTKRSSIIAAVTVVGVFAAGGVAFAYWTSNGSGTASADVASVVGNLTVTQDPDPASVITGLYPGGPGQDVKVIVGNPTTTDIGFSDVTMSVTGTSNPLCDAADFAIEDNPLYSGEVVPAGGDTGAIAPKTIRLRETGQNQDACKGVSVNLTLTAS